MGPLDPHVLADVEPLKRSRNDDLRDLGRLPYPMRRRAGEAGFTRISWDDALDEIAARIRTSGPDRLGVYLTSRGMPNESYYAAQKATRAMGTNNIENAARICHSPSTYGLKEALGVGATTCSYRDWIGSDLVVFFGSNVATNQPVAMKYLYHAKNAGTKVVAVNTFREPGMERYWVPSNVESALFGTKVADRFFLVTVGGDLAFLNGALKHIVEQGWYDAGFVADHTAGFDAMAAALETQEWDDLEAAAGATRDEMLAFARMVHEAKTAVFVWSMGVTQHVIAEDTVRALINLALTGGFVGRDKCGLMPIRGHSGVQGGAEMGAYATALPGPVEIDEQSAARFSALWGFDVPTSAGLTAPEMIDAAAAGELDVLVSCGGNFREVLPDPAWVEQALGRIPLRVHMDIVLTNQMLIDPPAGEGGEGGTVILLPATTRYEIPGGVTETSTERRIMFNPEIHGRRIGEARAELDVLPDLARRVRPDRAHLVPPATTAELRAEIAAAVPMYDGIQHLREKGDQLQYGGPHLCAGWVFPTPDGRAHFSAVGLPELEAVPEGMFRVATRRGKQFNSMIHEEHDAITGAARDAVFMAPSDAHRLGVEAGDDIRLTSATGSLAGRVFLAPVTPGTLQVHWPEGQVLIDRSRRSPGAGVPDYNALVEVARG
jgi:molybdopterin-dependent oxidoreductase alpha subunit